MPSRWADRWWSVGWFCVHRVQFEGSQNEPKQWSMAKPMDVNRQLLRKRAVSKSMLLLNGFTNVHHISCWLIKVAWQTFLSIMSMSTNSMFPGYPTRNSQSHKVSAFFNQHHWPPVCSSLSHSCCFFCCSAFGLSTVVPLDVPLGPFADGPHIGPRPSAIAHPTCWWRCLSAIATRGDQWWRLGWNYAKRWICFMFILIWEMIQFDSTLIFGNHWKTSNVEVKHLWWWFG